MDCGFVANKFKSKGFLQMIHVKKNYYFTIYFISLLFLIPKIGLLSRFPWQDFEYIDFQIYNRWRWTLEAIEVNGFFNVFTSVIDFRMNTGENIFLSNRASSFIFDIGNWVYFFTKSLDFALQFKFLIYTFFAYKGFIRLFQPLISSKKFSNFTYVLFSISLVSVIGNPILYHEAGPLTFWYLLLTPYWIHFVIKLNESGYQSIFKDYNLYLVLFLTIGASDLFIYFYFILFLFLPLVLEKKSFKRTFSLIIVIELILTIAKLPYLFFRLSENYQSFAGTWNSNQYFDLFIRPLLLHSLITPNFTGPVIIFINFAQLALIFYMITAWWKYSKNMLLLISFLLIFLLMLGFLLHSLSITRDILPSAFRYHVASWPILLSCLLPIAFYKIYSKEKINLWGISNKFLCIVLTLFITFSLANIDRVYSPFTPNSSKMLIDKELRKYTIQSLPNCINEAVQKSGKQKSFLFASGDGTILSASLNTLIDNPTAINGRTFNRWSYSSPSATISLNQEVGLEKFFTRPFSVYKTADIIEYSKTSGSYFLLSNNQIQRFKLLAICNSPSSIKSSFLPFNTPTLIDRIFKIKQNAGEASYQLPVYLYDLDYKMQEKIPINLQFSSANIKVSIDCVRRDKVTLPINYDDSIRIENLERYNISKNPKNNLVDLDLNDVHCQPGKNIELNVISFSIVPISDAMLFLVLFVLMMINTLPKIRKREQES